MRWQLVSKGIVGVVLMCFIGVMSSEEKAFLIEWSQTTPDSHLLTRYYEYWEGYLPYDGVVLYVNHKDYKGIYGERHMYAYPESQWPLHALVFSGKRVSYDDFKHAVDDLGGVEFKKFTHNFVLMSLYAGEPEGQIYDWWDDKLWEITIENVRVLGRIAKESGVCGIWFDTEEYAKWSYFNYHKNREELKDRPEDFGSYRRLLQKRGKELMDAIGGEYPGCEVVLTFGTTLVYMDVMLGKFGATRMNPSRSIRSLLPAFVDGMLLGGKKWGVKLIDGNENSYYFKKEEQFKCCREWTKNGANYLSFNPQEYSREIHVGFGLYPFCYAGIPERHFTPKQVQEAVFYALRYTDKYVWTWSEKATFWMKSGEEVKLPCFPHPSYVGEEEVNARNAMKKGTLRVEKGYLEGISEGKRVFMEQNRDM